MHEAGVAVLEAWGCSDLLGLLQPEVYCVGGTKAPRWVLTLAAFCVCWFPLVC